MASCVVSATEARTRLPQLLRDVQRGERFTITVRGRPVAELSPSERTPVGAQEAVAALKAFKLIDGVDAETIRTWIEDSRH